MIKIEQPKIIYIDNEYSRLSCNISVNGELRNVWFEVEKKYEQYLCTERSDAFLIGLLSWAMRLNHDIECVAPVTDELLYNIRTYLIPLISKYGKDIHNINIKAYMAPAIESGDAVGTGCSCGADSFHAILNNINSEYPNAKLTHLCLFNVGSFGKRKDEYIDSNELYNTRKKAVKIIADSLGLELIVTNSNFADVFIQDHLLASTYSTIFAVFCLQKLWKTYFYASAYDFGHFKLENNDQFGSSYTDLLLLNCFSNKYLRLYSEGGAKTRLEKLEYISDNELVQNFLHVCVLKSHNCGKCEKCVRTMNSLYALGKLDNFSKVFDVDYYKKNKNFYFENLYKLHLEKDNMTAPEYELLKKEIPLSVKLKKLKPHIINKYKDKNRKIRKSLGLYKTKETSCNVLFK